MASVGKFDPICPQKPWRTNAVHLTRKGFYSKLALRQNKIEPLGPEFYQLSLTNDLFWSLKVLWAIFFTFFIRFQKVWTQSARVQLGWAHKSSRPAGFAMGQKKSCSGKMMNFKCHHQGALLTSADWFSWDTRSTASFFKTFFILQSWETSARAHSAKLRKARARLKKKLRRARERGATNQYMGTSWRHLSMSAAPQPASSPYGNVFLCQIDFWKVK